MTPEQFQQLVQLVGNLGNDAYAAALRQVYIDAWANTIWAIILLLGIFICIRVFQSGIRDNRSSKDSFRSFLDDGTLKIFISGFAMFFMSLFTLISLQTAFSLFLSPQWNALEYLAKLVH